VSSAILYVAIVAIWACVLIPRWLRRGSQTSENHNHHQAERPVASPPEQVPSHLDEDEDEEEEEEETPAPEPVAPAPLTRAQPREKMMKARRRLLMLLIALEAAAGALTVMHLAALWVLIPPTIMLGGYVLLLREAAQMDRERVQREAEAQTARPRARATARDRDRDRRAQASAPPAPAPAPAPAGPPVSEPEPEDYEDLGNGRDYAPGLAGKYTTSNSEIIDLSEYKRAVGD
jgi:hypothetical protein